MARDLSLALQREREGGRLLEEDEHVQNVARFELRFDGPGDLELREKLKVVDLARVFREAQERPSVAERD